MMIPPMTHPLGKHWNQPQDIRQAPMDDKHVLLTPRQVHELPEYSASIPSGVYEGKCWKLIMRDNTHWLLWYANKDKDKDNCTINKREILIMEPA